MADPKRRVPFAIRNEASAGMRLLTGAQRCACVHLRARHGSRCIPPSPHLTSHVHSRRTT